MSVIMKSFLHSKLAGIVGAILGSLAFTLIPTLAKMMLNWLGF